MEPFASLRQNNYLQAIMSEDVSGKMGNEIIQGVQGVMERTAIGMLKQKDSLELIAQVTGLSIDEIIKLQISAYLNEEL